MSTGLLILVSAPSGAGKTSLVHAALQADPRLVASISHTTRPQRPGERDGVNYHFTDKTTFQVMVEAGEFLEHAVVFGNHYGTARASVAALRADDQDVILEIDWQGADQVRAVSEDVLSIFILPPSVDKLRERLTKRGQDAPQTIEVRLAEAQTEMAQAPRYDYIIVNEDFDQALAEMMQVIATARLQADVQLRNNPQVQRVLSGA